MIVAVICTILASFLWGITNHIDKFIVSGVNESGSNIKTLLVFLTLVTAIIFSPIWLIINKFNVGISNISLICVLIASFIYVLATYFYLIALYKDDALKVVVMFQLTPVFSFILEFIFFKENLTINQIIGSLIIFISAILISFDFDKKEKNNKSFALILMMFSSLFYAIYFFLFDIGIRNSSYNSCVFWYQIGFLILGIILFSIKSFRKTFIKAIRTNGKVYLSLNLTNELINVVANLLVNFANILIPLALVNVLTGLQGAFAFIIGVIGIKILPKYFKENLSKKVVIQKISCIILSIVGLIIMFV